MAELKRDIVKYIRDRAKNKYEKGSECYICGAEVKLDFHHYYSLAPLIHNWMKKTGHDPKYILAIRDDFIEEHWAELYEHTVYSHLKSQRLGVFSVQEQDGHINSRQS